MSRYKKGDAVLVKVEIVRDLLDSGCPKAQKGYEVATERGKVYCNPHEIVKEEVVALYLVQSYGKHQKQINSLDDLDKWHRGLWLHRAENLLEFLES